MQSKEKVEMLSALADITERHVNYSRPDLREDLLQAGMEAGLIALRTYRKARGMTRRNWVIKHMRRDMIRYLENERKHDAMDVDELLDKDDIDELTDHDFQFKLEDGVDARYLVSILHSDEAEAVYLHFFEDLSYSLIAERMSLKKQTVYRLISTAVKKLQSRNLLRK